MWIFDQVTYRAHARAHGFDFQLGTFTGLNRDRASGDSGPCTGRKQVKWCWKSVVFTYDYLVLAIGSVSNHFNTPGVQEHCIFLDSPSQANRFHRRLLEAYLKLNSPLHPKENLNIAIVGAGATGVELAAELHHAAAELNLYGFNDMKRDRLKISVIEAGPRILPALPERIAAAAHKELLKFGRRCTGQYQSHSSR